MTLAPPSDPHAAPRDARGRFQPGQSGNPAGKKLGTLNHATRIRQALEDGEFQIVARQLIDRAKDGEIPAMRILLDRLDPKPRGRPVALNFPVGASVLERFMYLSAALAAGEITPDEARTVALVLDLEGRERQRTLNADLALAKNRDAYLPHELEQTAKRFDALFPVSIWNPPEPKPEPDLHSACISEPAAPVQAPTLDPSPARGGGEGGGWGGGALLHSEQAAPTQAATLEPSPGGRGAARGADSDAPLHSSCKSPLRTPRRRAMNRRRAAVPGGDSR